MCGLLSLVVVSAYTHGEWKAVAKLSGEDLAELRWVCDAAPAVRGTTDPCGLLLTGEAADQCCCSGPFSLGQMK